MFNLILKNRIFKNAFWLLSEKIISIIGLLFVTSYVAKYIGPENFGKLNISVYYYSIIQTVALWGSDTIGVKRISSRLSSGLNFLYSFAVYRILVFIVISSVTEFYFFVVFDRLTFYFSLAVCASSFFSVIDVFNSYNEARLKSFYNVIANVIGITVSLLIRFVIAKLRLEPVYLCMSIFCTGLIPLLIRFLIFSATHSVEEIKKISFSYSYIRYGVITGVGLLISSVSVMIYVNISRVLLGYYNSLSDVGIYSVAMTLGTMWGFVNNAIVVSITPKLYSSHADKSNDITALTCQLLILVGCGYMLLYYVLGHFILHYLYGSSYLQAYDVTFLLIMSTCLSGIGMSISRYIISLDGYAYLAKKSLFVVVIGGAAAVFLISHYGLLGAALSAVVIELLSVSIMNLFFKTRRMLMLFSDIFNLKKTYLLIQSTLKHR